MGRVVGIDLGTTNSVVAVMEGGKPVVIANAEGMRTTPSVVGFSKEGERLVGQMARRQAVLDPQNTFYAVKRFMGRKYTELLADSKRVPYTIRKDDVGNIRIKCPRLQKEFAPEEVSAMILKKLAEEASRYLGEPVTGAVITVPAYFNDSQRQATRDAGRIAGLEVKRILNEPTAASLAYGLDRRSNQTILVFDLGGGTFDVSVLDVGDGVFQVKSTSGDTQLGGNDFDQRIVDWLAEQFLEQEGVDLRKDRQALQRLTEAAEKAKIELSGVTTTEINLPFITATADGPKHLETRLTRSQFEGLCNDLLTRLRGPVRQALRDAALGPGEIDEVVLVGGSSRIPVVQELVRSFIDREPNQNVNPDEVVAVGAAIQAGILAGEVKDILLLDVTPLSLGLETIGGVMKKLIPRNTTIPVRRSDIFSTGEDNQTMVEVHVLQGEREMAVGNKSLGRFKLVGIPPAPRGIPQVQVSFDIDANGILQVTAMDRTTGREQSVTIQEASTLSQDEVSRMIREAEEYADADRQRKAKVEKRNRAEALTFQAERQLREATLDFGMQFVSPYRTRIDRAVQQVREALNQNDDRGIDQAQADLQDALYDLNREVYQRNKEEEEQDSFFGAIKSFFTDDDEDYYYDDRRYGESRYGTSGSSWNDSPRYGSDRYGSGSSSWNDNRYERRDYSSSSSSSGNSWNDNRYDRRDYGSSSSTPRNDDRYGTNSGANLDRYERRDYGSSSSTPRNDDRYSAGSGANTDRSERRDYGSSTPRNNDRYGSGSSDSWYSDRPATPSPRYDDPYSSNRSNARNDDRSTRDRSWDQPEPSRSDNRSNYSSPSDYRPPAARPAERDRSERRPAARPPRNDRPNLYEDNWDDDDDWL